MDKWVYLITYDEEQGHTVPYSNSDLNFHQFKAMEQGCWLVAVGYSILTFWFIKVYLVYL